MNGEVEVLISASEIKDAVERLAKKIASDFKGRDVVLVPVLNGSYLFAADLSRALWDEGLLNLEIDFIGISSYGSGTKSSDKPVFTKNLAVNIENKHVVIIEDIIETGQTLLLLKEYLISKNPAEIKICTLLSKPKRKVELEPDYVGFEIDPDVWVEGYGLDTGFQGRGRSDIVKRK